MASLRARFAESYSFCSCRVCLFSDSDSRVAKACTASQYATALQLVTDVERLSHATNRTPKRHNSRMSNLDHNTSFVALFCCRQRNNIKMSESGSMSSRSSGACARRGIASTSRAHSTSPTPTPLAPICMFDAMFGRCFILFSVRYERNIFFLNNRATPRRDGIALRRAPPAASSGSTACSSTRSRFTIVGSLVFARNV